MGLGLVAPRACDAKRMHSSKCCLSATCYLLILADQAIDISFGVKRSQAIDFFTCANETNRQVQCLSDRKNNSTLGTPVELRKDHAGNTDVS